MLEEMGQVYEAVRGTLSSANSPMDNLEVQSTVASLDPRRTYDSKILFSMS